MPANPPVAISRTTSRAISRADPTTRGLSTGVAQINTAVAQLSQTTQQNASGSEELAATAEEMSSQAEQLRHTMAFFKLAAGPEMVRGAVIVPMLKKRNAVGQAPGAARSASAEVDEEKFGKF